MKTVLFTLCKKDAMFTGTELTNAENVIESFKYTVVKPIFHVFPNGAITWGFVLAESHFLLHTYPECNCVYCDLFTCRDEDVKTVKTMSKKIAEALNAQIVKFEIVER